MFRKYNGIVSSPDTHRLSICFWNTKAKWLYPHPGTKADLLQTFSLPESNNWIKALCGPAISQRCNEMLCPECVYKSHLSRLDTRAPSFFKVFVILFLSLQLRTFTRRILHCAHRQQPQVTRPEFSPGKQLTGLNLHAYTRYTTNCRCTPHPGSAIDLVRRAKIASRSRRRRRLMLNSGLWTVTNKSSLLVRRMCDQLSVSGRPQRFYECLNAFLLFVFWSLS